MGDGKYRNQICLCGQKYKKCGHPVGFNPTPPEPKASRLHHYVPQWYQKQFTHHADQHFFSINFAINAVRPDGTPWTLKPRFAKQNFYEKDLNTLRFGKKTSDIIETQFFGVVDDRGHAAMQHYTSYKGLTRGALDAHSDFCQYMGAQRMRTPRGLRILDTVRQRLGVQDPNAPLILLTELFQMNTTMWTEGIWEIVHAHNSPTKFIVSDNPVTFFNSAVPVDKEAGFESIGTRTIYPLDLNSCLIITHGQFANNPQIDRLAKRSNPRAFAPTFKMGDETQFGRELEEGEVLRINLILKRRAEKYIAAAEQGWLYPERHVSTPWEQLDHDWFLLPHLWKIHTGGEVTVGFNDGTAWKQDEYGRTPYNRRFKDQEQREQEAVFHDISKKAWAYKRQGKSRAMVEKSSTFGNIGDKVMDNYLKEHEGDEGIQRFEKYLTTTFDAPKY